MPDDDVMLLCMRTRDLEVPTPGSRRDTCGQCYEEVWVHEPALLEAARLYPGTVIRLCCLQCRPPDTPAELLPSQQVELTFFYEYGHWPDE